MSFTRARSFFRNLFRKQELDEQLDDELSSYVAMLVQEKIANGMDRDSAIREARLELGGREQVKEQVRSIRSGSLIEALLQDLRFGVRMIARNPGFSSVVVLTLALGIGANTAIFSVVYGVLLRPLPYRQGNQLVVLHQVASKSLQGDIGFSVKELDDYRNMNHSLQDIVEYHVMSFLLLGQDTADRVQTGVVSPNFFDVLGVKPLLGRTFVPSDDNKGSEAVIVLSYEYWQRNHGGDPNIVGKIFAMNDRPHRVIGVLPPVPQYPNENDIYMPTSGCPTRSSPKFIADRKSRMMNAFGRLKPGVPLDAARADLSTAAAAISRDHPDVYPASIGYGMQASSLQAELTQRARITLLVLLGAASFVLLIACANVANLMLARLLQRERELALRSALGASKPRIVRQLLTETVMLATLGGALGLAIAPPALTLLVRFAARFTTRATEVKLDLPVLAFTLALSVVAGLIFGVAPAVASTRDLNESLKSAGAQTTMSSGRRRLRSALVVAQVAISFVLLIAAGLMLRSIYALQKMDPGFRSDRLLTLRVSWNFSKYKDGEAINHMEEEALRKVQALGGVETAAFASNFPFSKSGIQNGPNWAAIEIQDRPLAKGDVAPQVNVAVVSPSFISTLRLPLIAGRFLGDQDNKKDANRAVINATMARHRWPNESAVGKRIRGDDASQPWTEIVGVVGDVREYGLDQEVPETVYITPAEGGAGNKLLVRTTIDPLSVAPLVRQALRQTDREIAIDDVSTVDLLKEQSFSSSRTTMLLLSVFAALALIISATGIAGVMALSISQRSHELGIRLALGQSTASVLKMVVQQGIALSLAGTILGILGALGVSRLIASLLYHTSPADLPTYVGVAMVFLLAASVSCFLPARRVTRIDPSQALHQE